MTYSMVKLPIKAFTENGSGVLEFKCGLMKYERDDLHTLTTIFPSNPENVKIRVLKLVKE